MDSEQYLPLIREVLAAGPNDAKDLIQHAEVSSMSEALYLASRNSEYATTWRRIFGEHRLSQSYPRSILELAVMVLDYEAEYSSASISTQTMLMVKLVANCCIDNVSNKRMVIQTRGLTPLMRLLANGVDPNVLVPTIYNICVDFDDLSEDEIPDAAVPDGSTKVNLAEETLARIDMPHGSAFTGLLALLIPHVVQGCDPQTGGYLSELIEMSSRLAATSQRDSDNTGYADVKSAIDRLLDETGGDFVAKYSVSSRIDIIRSLFAMSSSESAKDYLASSGKIYDFALVADYDVKRLNYAAEEDEIETLLSMQTLMLKMAYDLCQRPRFVNPPKYGIARLSLNIVSGKNASSSFQKAVAFVVLYGFLDGDPRAYLLANEGLTASVGAVLSQESDKQVIHPALGVAIKLALTWYLRKQLSQYQVMEAVQRLLTDSNLGYEIPLSAVTLLRLMIKGHPSHIITLVQERTGNSIIRDVFKLFDKGHDAICLEIGLLAIEICATLGTETHSAPSVAEFSLNSIIGGLESGLWSQVFVFMATKGQTVDAAISQRVWLALGLLSRTSNGKHIILSALQDSTFVKSIEEFKAQRVPGVAENIDFMVYHMQDQLNEIDLDTAMNQMSLN